MTDLKALHWLMDNADAPVRYRTARELLHDLTTAKKLESDLLGHPLVGKWLQNMQPELPQRNRWLEHGSFDICLENAMLKSVQLGLHGGLQAVISAVGYYLAKMQYYAALPQKRQSFPAILTANLLSLAGVEDIALRQYMLASLDEMHRFTQANRYDFYYGEEDRARLAGIPTCWKTRRHIIRQELFEEYGFAYPLIYDIVGLHALYRLCDPETDRKISDVIRYIATDAFRRAVADGYGILAEGNGVYHGMGWDPKFPGWFDAAGYSQTGPMQKLLFHAQYACRYPAVREVTWYRDLLSSLEAYQTEDGWYAFPAAWFAEKQGYAVMGSHLSFGENRRKKNWREIESTFYMQLLKQPQE
jgi:hypothetical protein